MRKVYLIIFILTCLINTLIADVKLPALFGNGMVLQQKSLVSVWGWANPGEKVIVQGNWRHPKISTYADENGTWILKLKTPKAGGPYTMIIRGNNQIEIDDILIGEVWICSGQSNMDMWMDKGAGKDGVLNYKEEIQNANYPSIRLFQVDKNIAITPKADCVGEWKVCNPENVAKFSAVAYYFGLEIYKNLQIPIGLIQSSWGGTPAEAWTSREALENNPDCAFYLDKYNKYANSQDKIKQFEKEYQEDFNKWMLESYALDKHVWRDWIAVEFNDSDWPTMTLPTPWDDGGLPDFEGVVWFRRHFIITQEMLRKELVFDLGPIDDMDRTFINGVKVGETQQRGKYKVPRIYTIPADLLVVGDNVISVRVTNYKGHGGIYGDGEHLKIYVRDNQSMSVSVSGEWKYQVAYNIKSHRPIPNMPKNFDKYTATVLYNGMLSPLIPYTIQGVVWYQGEANCNRAYLYQKLFPLMISDWRTRWNQGNFPFYFVQIAPFDYKSENSIAAELRESQRLSMKVPNTGMIVTTDIGNIDDIHPRDKKEVGRRLSLWALAKTYGENRLVYSGPLYKCCKREDNKIRINFDYAEGGLVQQGSKLSCFTIAGTDSVFVQANAEIDGESIIVWGDSVVNPIAVRFGWSNIAEPNLFNQAGLPASPFRTDNFPLSTQNKNKE